MGSYYANVTGGHIDCNPYPRCGHCNPYKCRGEGCHCPSLSLSVSPTPSQPHSLSTPQPINPATSLHPTHLLLLPRRDPAFLANVAAEVGEQARRIGHHASIVLWGGNNEVEASIGWYDETKPNPLLYAVDYQVLFVGVVRAAVMQVGGRSGGVGLWGGVWRCSCHLLWKHLLLFTGHKRCCSWTASLVCIAIHLTVFLLQSVPGCMFLCT